MKFTKLSVLSLLMTAVFAAAAVAQMPERRIIEVTGSAETLVTPNEFTFKITLLERMEGKQKLTIEMQEANLRRELSSIGIDVAKNLTIFDLTSFYIARKKTKDTLGAKDYRLKLTELSQIEKLQEIADRLNLSTLDLIETNHSDIIALRKETKMEAVKAAKAKAEYMLGAIGERVGKTVYMKEVEGDSGMRFGNLNSNSNVFTEGVTAGRNDQQNSGLTFSKIKLRYEVVAKFEIE